MKVRPLRLICGFLLLAALGPASAQAYSPLARASYQDGAPHSVRVGMPCPGRPGCFAPGVPACSVCCKTYQAAVCAPGNGRTASCRCEW
jgi:hypothetical protein